MFYSSLFASVNSFTCIPKQSERENLNLHEAAVGVDVDMGALVVDTTGTLQTMENHMVTGKFLLV